MYVWSFSTVPAVGWPNHVCKVDITKANGYIVRNGIIDWSKFTYCVCIYLELFKDLGATLKLWAACG